MSGVTLRDVARECQLSVATVSRVLSGSSYPVRQETRLRILDTAKKVGYVPNLLARGLKSRVSREAAVIIPSLQNPFYTSLVGGIEHALFESAYGMSLYLSEHYLRRTELLISNLVGKMPSGIIIVSDSVTPELLGPLRRLQEESRLPIIAVDYQISGWDLPGVYFNYFEGGKMAAEYLYSKGHTRIAYAFCPMDRETRRARWAGVMAACQEIGGNCLMDGYYGTNAQGDFTTGEELAYVIMNSGKVYSAIIANNDIVAMGILVGLAKMKVRVPEDVSIIGFDDCVYAAMSHLELTTVRVPSDRMGNLAAQMLLNELDGKNVQEEHLKPSIVERSSVLDLSSAKM